MRPCCFLLCLGPALWLAGLWWFGALGVDPLARLLRFSGQSATWLLLITLSITPLRRLSVFVSRQCVLRFGRRLSDWNALIRLRRQLGLFTFFYATLHLAIYLCLDLGLDPREFAADLRERPFIAIGLAVFGLLLPLAATSTQAAMRRLGRGWRVLHLLVYPAAIGALAHDWLQTKIGQPLPLASAALLALLLAARLLAWRRGDRSAATEVPQRGLVVAPVRTPTTAAPPPFRCSRPSAACASGPRTGGPR